MRFWTKYAPALPAFFLVFYVTTAAPSESMWRLLPSGIETEIKSVCFSNSSMGYASGEAGTILKTTDGGEHWTALESGTGVQLWNIALIPSGGNDMGFAVGDGGTILKTTDGGATWTKQNSGLKDGLVQSFLFHVFPLDEQRWFAAGGDGEAFSGVILSTDNGGQTWVKHHVPGTLFLDRCVFLDAQTGYAVGLNSLNGGSIFKTVDGGQTWQEQYSSGSIIAGLWCAGPNLCWAVGSTGQILHTTDGETWTAQNAGTTADLLAVCFSDNQNGMVCGFDGTILRTNNGGTTWTDASYELPTPLNSIQLIDNGATAIAVGRNGTILKMSTLTSVPEELSMPFSVRLLSAAAGHSTVSVQAPESTIFPVSLSLHTIGGKAIGGRTLYSPAAVFDVGSIPNGTYLYVVRDASGRVIGRGRIPVE